MSRHAFMTVTETVIYNSEGPVVRSFMLRGKAIAPYDRPVSEAVAALAERLKQSRVWPSAEEAKAGIQEAIEFLEEFKDRVE